uniref:Uncharacterized protein n=1 Tax=Cacopsylla melanoneura TaxID=428564 RepID=A0A8D8WGY8_9HEMI
MHIISTFSNKSHLIILSPSNSGVYKGSYNTHKKQRTCQLLSYKKNSSCAPVGMSSPLISVMIIFNRHSSNLDLPHDFSSFKIIGRDVLELKEKNQLHTEEQNEK